MFLLENNIGEELIKQIADELKEHCSKFIGKHNSEEIHMDIKDEVNYILIEGKLKL